MMLLIFFLPKQRTIGCLFSHSGEVCFSNIIAARTLHCFNGLNSDSTGYPPNVCLSTSYY